MGKPLQSLAIFLERLEISNFQFPRPHRNGSLSLLKLDQKTPSRHKEAAHTNESSQTIISQTAPYPIQTITLPLPFGPQELNSNFKKKTINDPKRKSVAKIPLP